MRSVQSLRKRKRTRMESGKLISTFFHVCSHNRWLCAPNDSRICLCTLLLRFVTLKWYHTFGSVLVVIVSNLFASCLVCLFFCFFAVSRVFLLIHRALYAIIESFENYHLYNQSYKRVNSVPILVGTIEPIVCARIARCHRQSVLSGNLLYWIIRYRRDISRCSRYRNHLPLGDRTINTDKLPYFFRSHFEYVFFFLCIFFFFFNSASWLRGEK